MAFSLWRCTLGLGAPLLLALALPAVAAGEGAFVLTPDALHWQAGAAGPQRLLVHADEACRVITRRVRLPAGLELPPHGHAKGYRLVTVISGTLQIGFGERFDAAALQSLPPGSVFSEPAGHKHFVRTGAEPVVLQLTEVDGDASGCQPTSGVRP
ncbi:DUF4437 domain-containing protein [Comamonadaceae bacterium OH2545_COT-014]|nr:DUF4437 domain-containing protein [Comamonadaceae bacterium OH2545_COT-014]